MGNNTHVIRCCRCLRRAEVILGERAFCGAHGLEIMLAAKAHRRPVHEPSVVELETENVLVVA